LFDHGTFDGGEKTYPNGCHVCEVEIDEETGEFEIVRYSAVDDVGNMINPLLVEGQVHGGVVQGLGQAFMEGIIYDSSGQLVTGSFMDYQMPRAADFPPFKLGENVVATETNPLGVKGAGESGTVGALAAAMIAINHALEGIGADYLQMPATPQRLWMAIQAAKQKSGSAA
jgi:carbon-monoxide dehydrogenase large subunit